MDKKCTILFRWMVDGLSIYLIYFLQKQVPVSETALAKKTKNPWMTEESQMGTGRFGHSTSSATLYKDVSAMVLFMLFYVLFITMLCINNHIEYKKK
jgi:succinate dehydrogenase hydrophobic anchor subunit